VRAFKRKHVLFFSFILFVAVQFAQFYKLQGSTSDTHLKLQYLIKVCKCRRKSVFVHLAEEFEYQNCYSDESRELFYRRCEVKLRSVRFPHNIHISVNTPSTFFFTKFCIIRSNTKLAYTESPSLTSF